MSCADLVLGIGTLASHTAWSTAVGYRFTEIRDYESGVALVVQQTALCDLTYGLRQLSSVLSARELADRMEADVGAS